jgi:hypothetical protein
MTGEVRVCGFTELELAHLTLMRDRYRAGDWPAASDGKTLIKRLGIVMAAIPLGVGEGGVVRYRCVLRKESDGGAQQLEALFQVMPIYPAPPDAREVLTWLAAAVANNVLSRDLDDWGLLVGISATGRVRTLPYRGLVHEESDMGAFVLGQYRKAEALREFLGSRGFQELMQEVGIC